MSRNGVLKCALRYISTSGRPALSPQELGTENCGTGSAHGIDRNDPRLVSGPQSHCAGVGASPALRFQLRLPGRSTCSRRWRERASERHHRGPAAVLLAATTASISATSASAAAKAATKAQGACKERLSRGTRLRERTW